MLHTQYLEHNYWIMVRFWRMIYLSIKHYEIRPRLQLMLFLQPKPCVNFDARLSLCICLNFLCEVFFKLKLVKITIYILYQFTILMISYLKYFLKKNLFIEDYDFHEENYNFCPLISLFISLRNIMLCEKLLCYQNLGVRILGYLLYSAFWFQRHPGLL